MNRLSELHPAAAGPRRSPSLPKAAVPRPFFSCKPIGHRSLSRSLGLALSCVFLQAAAPLLGQSLANGFLTVTVDGDSFRLQAALDEVPFGATGRWPNRVQSCTPRQVEDPVWGLGQQLSLHHTNGWRSALTLFPGSPFVQITTWVTNASSTPWMANRLELLQVQVRSGQDLDRLRVIGTGGVRPPFSAEGSYTFLAAADPVSRHGLVAAFLTHERGVGAFFPNNNQGDRSFDFDTRIDFGHLQVDPGQSRPTETLLLGCFADTRLGLENYADAVARHYRITLPETPGVYCTWYHSGASDEERIAANTEFAADQLRPFGLTVMQIDDQWQRRLPRGFPGDENFPTTGPIKVFVDSREDNYPSGMAHTARRIAAAGMIPGIWFMPFAGNYANPYFDTDLFARKPDGTPFHDSRWSGTCLDLTHPRAQTFVFERTKRIYDWGYRYFKIDGMHTGLATYNIYVHTAFKEQNLDAARLHNPGMTHVEAYRQGLKILREAAPEALILGCNVSQNMLSMGPAFGLIDAMRIGPDNGGAARGSWDQVTLGAWHGNNLYFLNNRVWHNDPDPVYVRTSNPLSKARWMCSWLALSGSMHTSSEQYSELEPERLDLLKRCLPAHVASSRPVDYLETDRPRIWLAQNDRLQVIGLFNWQEQQPTSITLHLERLDLDPTRGYVAFDFWADRFLPVFTRQWVQELDPASCSVLAIRPAADHPQVISTSRHITQGLIDVTAERWDPATRTLRGMSQVVAGDPYEIRLALPANAAWRVAGGTAGDAPLTPVYAEPHGVRLSFTPRDTGSVRWQIGF